jgi:hypothetical protein
MCQVEREAAHWRPVGLAVAWSGSRVAGRQRLPLAWSVSGGARWRSAGKWCQVEDEAAHWRPIGLAVVCWSGPRVAVSKASVGQCLVAIPGKRCQAEDETTHWRPIGLAVAWSGSRVAVSKASVGRCLVAIGRQAVPGRRRGSALAAGRACCGLVRVSGYWPWCSITGSSSGSSFSRSVKPATRRRRRQCRAVPVAIAGKRCQGEGETAHRQPIGRAVAWSGCRVAGRGGARYRAVLRVFVLSIGEAGHEATTAPASSSAGWRSPASGARSKARQRTGSRSGVPWPGQDLGVLPGRRRGSALAADRACRGLWSGSRVAVSKASVGQCLVAIDRQAVPGRRRGSALATGRACRGLVRISGCGQRGERRAVLGDDRRQAVPGRRRGSALATGRACRGLVRISGCGQQGERRAVLGSDRPASGARSKTRQRTGNRSGLPWSGQDLGLRSARRASCSAWWRSPASGARSKTRQRTGNRSGLPWSGQDLGLRSARRASCSAWWRSPASGARSNARQRTGGRPGLLWSAG